MQAFDIWVGDKPEEDDRGAMPLPAGWAGPDGPGIDVRSWPRSPRTGQPMLHCFTLWLPEAYRRRGDDLVAVSIFQWNDECYAYPPVREPEQAVAHPWLHLADDGVDHLFAMIWLTDAEFRGPRTLRPPHAAAMADGERDSSAVMRRYGLFGPLWLYPRYDDPNVGVAPVDFPVGVGPYVEVADRYDRFHDEHLGGTAMAPNGVREGVSPWYIEANRLGGLSHGGDEDIVFDLGDSAFLGGLTDGMTIAPSSPL
ncbi:MAG: hypothetical protein HOV79_21430 [Hamadaea sp.]|nr:hypothetical protein [Hamadaea sp.]